MQENARSHNNVVFVCTYPKTNYFLNIQKEKLRKLLMVSRNVKIWTNLSLVSFVAFCDNDSHLFQAWYRWQIFKTKTYKRTKIRILVQMWWDIKCLLKNLFDYAVINQKSLFIPNEVIITFSHEPTHTIIDKMK